MRCFLYFYLLHVLWDVQGGDGGFLVCVYTAYHQKIGKKDIAHPFPDKVRIHSLLPALAVRSGLEPGIAAEKGAEELLRMEIGASLIWTLLVLVLTVKCSTCIYQ